MHLIYKKRPSGLGTTRRESIKIPVTTGALESRIREWKRQGYNYVGDFISGQDIRLSDGDFALVKKL